MRVLMIDPAGAQRYVTHNAGLAYLSSGPRLTDCTLFGSFPEPDRHTAASAKPSEFVPHRDFRSNGHYFPHI